MNVAVLGASPNPERYSNRAVALLKAAGHTVFPVHPAADVIHDLPVRASLREIPGTVDTVTVYLGPKRSSELLGDLIALRPRRVIFNPGAENEPLARDLEAAGIVTLEACTLVLLRTDQF